MNKLSGSMNTPKNYADFGLLHLDSNEDQGALFIFILMFPPAPLLLDLLGAKAELIKTQKSAAQL